MRTPEPTARKLGPADGRPAREAEPIAPRAYRLDEGAPEVEITPEPEEIAAAPVDAARPRGVGALGWLLAGLGGLATLALGLWVENTIRMALAGAPWLGGAALLFAGVALAAGLVILGRALIDILRQARVDRLRGQAEAALAARDAAAARAVATQLAGLGSARPETARARARFAEAEPALTDARDLLTLAERELVAPLDKAAANEIAKAARQVSVVTAVSPRALIDLVFVIYAGGRLLRAVARIYGGNPGTLGLLKLARSVLAQLLVTGGLAAGEEVVQQLVGQGLAARLSAKLGEGVLNGLMTARMGLAAIAVCRPLPFIEARPPTLSDVASGLLAGRAGSGDETD